MITIIWLRCSWHSGKIMFTQRHQFVQYLAIKEALDKQLTNGLWQMQLTNPKETTVYPPGPFPKTFEHYSWPKFGLLFSKTELDPYCDPLIFSSCYFIQEKKMLNKFCTISMIFHNQHFASMTFQAWKWGSKISWLSSLSMTHMNSVVGSKKPNKVHTY